MDASIPHLEIACRILEIFAMLLGAPGYFTPIMQFLVLFQPGMRSTTARFVYMNDQYECLSVPDYNALYCIGFHWFI